MHTNSIFYCRYGSGALNAIACNYFCKGTVGSATHETQLISINPTWARLKKGLQDVQEGQRAILNCTSLAPELCAINGAVFSVGERDFILTFDTALGLSVGRLQELLKQCDSAQSPIDC